MRTPAPQSRPVALTIAGSDSGGGAGIQADLATMATKDVFGTSAVTAITAQNTRGVKASHPLPVETVTAQINAVTDDFAIGGAKTGMLATTEIVEAVADRAASFTFPLVVDPVMVAATGDRLLEPEAEAAYEALFEHAAVVTPNADEAEVLTDVAVEDEQTAREAGTRLRELGADAALVKGGHVDGDPVTDVLVTADGTRSVTHPRVETQATHGSGCTLAAAIAAELAKGRSIEESVVAGIEHLGRAVRYYADVGSGPGAVNHTIPLVDQADREPTLEAVAGIVEGLVEVDVSPIVPEVGMNVAGATVAAESPRDVAAVEGRITRTLSGVAPNRGVRFGASSHVARFLISAREFAPDLRFAVNARFSPAIESALEALEWPVAEYDRAAEPADASTMDWAAREVFGDRDQPPVAIVDRGAVGKEAITKLVATDAETLEARVLQLARQVAERS